MLLVKNLLHPLNFDPIYRLILKLKRHLILKIRGDKRRKCNNTNVIDIIKNYFLHSRIKRIDILYYFIQDIVEDKIISL